MLKKSIAIMIMLSLMISLIGCSKEEKVTGKEENGTKIENNKKNEKPVKLTVSLFDRNKVPESEGTLQDNRWTNWIKEEMLARYNIEVDYVPIPRSEEQTKLNILLSTGNAPDIIFTYNRYLFTKYASEGGLNDLSDSLAAYGENLTSFLGNDILKHGVVGGHQYAIPSRRMRTAHWSSFIRQDWLDKVNMDIPTNVDELKEVLMAFKEQDPGNMGEKNIPMLVEPKSGRFSPHSHNHYDLMTAFMKHDEREEFIYPAPLREGFKDYMAFLNDLYQNGLVDKEFATLTKDMKKQKTVTGQVGFLDEAFWNVPKAELEGVLMENIPGAKFTPMNAYQNVKDNQYYKTAYPPVGLYVMSPKTNKNTDAVIKYLDFLAEPENMFKLKYGVEGEHYELQGKVPAPKDIEHNKQTLKYINNDLGLSINGEMLVGTDLEEMIILNDPKFGADYIKAQSMTTSGTVVPEILLDKELESEKRYLPQLEKLYDQYWVKMIMIDDFETAYNEFQQELKNNGIEEIVKEREELYNSTH